METILVATDYSAAAANALAYASNLARHLGERLVICHAYYMVVTHMNVPKELPGEKELIEENTARLKKLAAEVTKNYGLATEYMTGPMPATDFLRKCFHQTQASLLVMGMRQLSKLDQLFFGSTTVSVINEGIFPVMVIPEHTAYTPLSRILLATDFRLHEMHSLALLTRLAQTYKAAVQVLHVAENATAPGKEETSQLDKLRKLLPDISHEYVVSLRKDVSTGIKEAISQYTPDLLVMLPQQHDFWDLALNRSNTRKLAFQTTIPLLALPASTVDEKEYRPD
jgi:nucleotide-binding universal stress UspA family protein